MDCSTCFEGLDRVTQTDAGPGDVPTAPINAKPHGQEVWLVEPSLTPRGAGVTQFEYPR